LSYDDLAREIEQQGKEEEREEGLEKGEYKG
jgi:hypothetical protein